MPVARIRSAAFCAKRSAVANREESDPAQVLIGRADARGFVNAGGRQSGRLNVRNLQGRPTSAANKAEGRAKSKFRRPGNIYLSIDRAISSFMISLVPP